MRFFVLTIILCFILNLEAYAYKKYSYDSNGNRIYTQITPEIAHKNKSRKRHSHIYVPREKRKYRPMGCSRKRTLSQFAKGQ